MTTIRWKYEYDNKDGNQSEATNFGGSLINIKQYSETKAREKKVDSVDKNEK